MLHVSDDLISELVKLDQYPCLSFRSSSLYPFGHKIRPFAPRNCTIMHVRWLPCKATIWLRSRLILVVALHFPANGISDLGRAYKWQRS
jgi:hypothetical protein